jgi:lysophospholipase L1-like esterase
MNEEKQLQTHALNEIEYIKVHGRTTGQLSPLTLFWTGSAVELNAKGSELWVEVEAGYDVYEPWIGIVINSAPVSRLMITEGRHWICVFRGMNSDQVKNVRIVKEVQAMSGDQGCFLHIHSVKFDGHFLPIEEKPYKIEFIGDSITSGEGIVGAQGEEDWIPMWFSATGNYTELVANALNAEYRVLSQSGWGVFTSWDNNPHCNMQDNYEKVCGILQGKRNEALGALQENNFASWQPDVIVVNLGTNDASAFDQPQWKDEVTGETHKQRRNEDGSFHEEDIKAFEGAIVKFLTKLRKYNNKAQIVWAYGMIGITMMPYIYRAVEAYYRETGDKKVSVYQLPNTTEATMGSRSHPGHLSHLKAATELSEYLRDFLK